MTWRPEDRLRQTNTRGKRERTRKSPEGPRTAPEPRGEMEPMPTMASGTMSETMEDDARALRMPMEQEQALTSMGFVPDRQWNLIRQWMFRGTTAL